MGAVVTVIATGVAIIEQERNRINIPREPRINAIAQREIKRGGGGDFCGRQ